MKNFNHSNTANITTKDLLTRKLVGPSFRQAPAHGVRSLTTSAQSKTASLMDRVFWFPRTFPFVFQAIFATGKTAISDLVVQVFIEKKEEIDWKRTSVFAAFGFGYLGCAQWFFYVTCMKRLFPNMASFAAKPLKEKLKDGPGLKALVGQIGFDLLVVTPFFYFPFFYMFKQSIQGGFNFGELDPATVVADAWAKYKFNMVDDLTAFWSLWLPGDIFIYAIPIWMRLPANHLLSWFWTMFLSAMRGDAIEEAGADAMELEDDQEDVMSTMISRRDSRKAWKKYKEENDGGGKK